MEFRRSGELKSEVVSRSWLSLAAGYCGDTSNACFACTMIWSSEAMNNRVFISQPYKFEPPLEVGGFIHPGAGANLKSVVV